ncbi:hypothetical protein D6853_07060 [Butyrivibrio sp. X503]|uniref:hypothetical protein n=1 Tax=Butyrivibrio sp. X503 TaxID=2364878 RepID=UPI000EA8F092|nr:hypothetical protein [Butyrivibrio sp. X503]RKM56539.1 hypothetical protein D6853_07060 [Butyrivibrio sp. X503]
MKRFFKIAAVVAMGVVLCACSMSSKSASSETGQVKITVKDSSVELNHVKHDFPKEYTVSGDIVTKPIGMSYAEVKKDGNLVGVATDGMYKENITKDNMVDAANTAFMTFHNVDTPLEITQDMFLDGKNIEVLTIELTDGIAVFIAQTGTPNFVYMTELNTDSEKVMEDFVGSAVQQIGGDEDYATFFG